MGMALRGAQLGALEARACKTPSVGSASSPHPGGVRRALVVDAAMRVPGAPAIVLPQLVALRRPVMQHLRLHMTCRNFVYSIVNGIKTLPPLWYNTAISFQVQSNAQPGSPPRW